MFVGTAIEKQAEALRGVDIEICPSDCDKDMIRVVYGIASELAGFVQLGHTAAQYVPFVQRFHGPKSYSTQSFTHLIRIFGIHAALYFDNSLIKLISESVVTLLQTYQAVAADIDSHKGNPVTAAANPKVVEASKQFLSVAIALTMRLLIRRAAHMVMNEAVPGLSEVISGQNKKARPADWLLNEVTSSARASYFVIEQVKAKFTQRPPGSFETYFGYLAALFGNPAWKNAKFFEAQDALENNIHCLPYAWALMADLGAALFGVSDEKTINLGIDAFFRGLSLVFKGAEQAGPGGSAYLILVDKFTILLPELHYGHIEKYFPYGAVTSGYPSARLA
jgi:hypothetical protein